MQKLLPVLLFLVSTICCAEKWVYMGEAKDFIPVSSQIGNDWGRSLIITANEANEMNKIFSRSAPHEIDMGITTSYEIFRRKNMIRELSEAKYYFKSSDLGKQTYQLVIFLFEDHEGLERYWNATHPEHLQSPVFTITTKGTHNCVFRLQNIYVRVASKSLSTECERIAGMVFNSILAEENESKVGNSNFE
ncbi:MAG: hypothetical protein ACSHYA_01240 [Opitutaceae bacterium]